MKTSAVPSFFAVLTLSLLLSGSSRGAAPAVPPRCTLKVSSPQECTSPAALSGDFDCRYTAKSPFDPPTCGNGSKGCGSWGPHPIQHPPPAFSGTPCGDADWQRQRLLAAVDYLVLKQLNYCHHHDPRWMPPSHFQITGQDKAGPLTCTSSRSSTGAQARPKQAFPDSQVQWLGVDCSNFTSFLYNFSLGLPRMTGAIREQSCGEGPGVLLDVNAFNFDTMKQYLLPGDLLYILAQSNPNSTGQARRISHVVVWTGRKLSDLDTLIQDGKSDASIYKGGDFESYGPLEDATTPLIVDSHYAGPAYRPFIGWYRQSLSHVRRIIGADQVPAALPRLNVLRERTSADDDADAAPRSCQATQTASGATVSGDCRLACTEEHSGGVQVNWNATRPAGFVLPSSK